MKYTLKYALEYDPTDPNTLTIHFNKALIEISESPEKDIKAEATYECVTPGDNNTIVDDFKDDKDDAEMIFFGIINKDTISSRLKMMGNTIYSLKGVRDVEIGDYEIILVKNFFFEWRLIVDLVIATVLIFLEPSGKATEVLFNQTETGRKNKKGNKAKKGKTKTAEISWKFQET